jgi:hypothetical protein
MVAAKSMIGCVIIRQAEAMPALKAAIAANLLHLAE